MCIKIDENTNTRTSKNKEKQRTERECKMMKNEVHVFRVNTCVLFAF